jgi:proteasome lid subunit RPN8/RPN11
MDTRYNIEQKILQEIVDYCSLCRNEESCGIIVQLNDSQKFIPCENIAIDKQKYFALDSSIYIDYDVDMIVHSHCLGSATPSKLDRSCSDDLEVPFLIYSIIDDNFCLYENKSVIEFKV